MLRIFAALMFPAAGALAGSAVSLRLRERRELCRCIGLMLNNTAIMIRCTAADVYELTGRLRITPGLSALSFIGELPDRFEPGRDFHEVWSEALSAQEMPDEERQILSELGSALGRSDAEGQLSLIEGLNERLKRITSAREEAYDRKGRMYRSVGILFGVMAGILVI